MRKILLLVLVLVSFSAIGQVVQFPTNYGVGYRRTGADTLLWIPTDTFAVPAPLASRTHVARKASNLYYWNGNKWASLSGGGSTDTTSLSNRINLKLNISDTSSMLTNYINGVGYALLKTGQTVRADSATLANYFLRRKDSVAGGYYPYSSNPLGYVTTNYYNSDGTLSGNRTVDGNNKTLTYNNLRDININNASGYKHFISTADFNVTSLDGFGGAYFDLLPTSSEWTVNNTGFSKSSSIYLDDDSIKIIPQNGKINIVSLATGGTSADSVVVITSGGQLKKRNTADFGGSQTWQQTLTTGSTLTGANTIAGGAYNFTFGNMGLFTISQTAKASVSGSNGTAHVSPLTITGGNGGATSYSTGTVSGGNAGNVSVTAGNGGDITGTPTTGIGGTGGYIDLIAGDGGLGTTFGGTAGFVNIQGGTSGGGTSAGSAGYVSIKGGMAASTGNGYGGDIYLSPGAKNGSGLDGHIFLGVSPSATVRGSATIGSSTRGDSLFNIKDGGLYADRGVRFPNTPSFADTTNYKPVVMNSSGTLYKATYWPVGSGGGTPAGNYGNIQINRNGAFATPSTDSLGYTASGGLLVKNKIDIRGDLLSPGSSGTGNFKAGPSATITSNDGVSIGNSASVTGLGGIAIGYQAAAAYSGSVAIGYQAAATSNNDFVLGTTSNTVRVPGKFALVAGQTSALFTAPQIIFGYNGTTDYAQWIHTRHNGGVSSGNAIDLATSDGTAAGTYQSNSIHGLTIENGKVGAATTAPNSTLHSAGSFATAYIAKAVDYTATISDCVIEVTATGKTITLPTAASISGRHYTIKLTASGSGTVGTTSSQTIDGATTYSLSAQYKYVTVVSNGSNWIITANN